MSVSIGHLLTKAIGDKRRRDLDVVVVHIESRPQSMERSWRRKWFKKDQRPEWIKEWLPQDMEKLGARVIDFRCMVDEQNCSNLSYYVDVQSNTLLALLRERRSRTGQERPIVFIGQSIGGLVVTRALARAARVEPFESKSKAIFASTKMVIFLATPHPIIDVGTTEWRNRLMDSLSRFGHISRNSLRKRLSAEQYDILRLQADCYKSIEGKIRNVMIRESRPDTGRMPRKQQVLTKEPDVIPGHRNWSVIFGTVDFDTNPARQRGESYMHMLSWVENSPRLNLSMQQASTLSKITTSLPDGQRYSADDYKRLIEQCEHQSHISKETLSHLNNLARIYTKDSRFQEARWLYERIQIAIMMVWGVSSASVDASTLSDILPMLRSAAWLAGRQGRYQQGVHCLQSILQLSRKASASIDADMCRVHTDIGVLYGCGGRLDEARKAYDHALQLAEDCNASQQVIDSIKLNRRTTDELLSEPRFSTSSFALFLLCTSMLAVLLFWYLAGYIKEASVTVPLYGNPLQFLGGTVLF